MAHSSAGPILARLSSARSNATRVVKENVINTKLRTVAPQRLAFSGFVISGSDGNKNSDNTSTPCHERPGQQPPFSSEEGFHVFTVPRMPCGPLLKSVSALGASVPPTFTPPHQILPIHSTFTEQKRTFINLGSSSSKRIEYSERRLLGYTEEQMFEVVSDVAKYKEFVPYCRRSDVFSRRSNSLKARIEVGFPPITESYVSVVMLARPHMVKSVCIDGKLFAHLVCDWRFGPGVPTNPNSCTLNFSVSFEFRSALHSHLANAFFDQVVGQQVTAFLQRAEKCYGKPSQQPVLILSMTSAFFDC